MRKSNPVQPLVYLLQQAQLAFKENKLAQAEAYLFQVLHIDPTNIAALDTLGSMTSLTGKYRESLQYFEKAVATGLDDPDILFHYALLLHRLARYHRACTQYEKVLHLRPDDQLVLNNYCVVSIIIGDLEKAEDLARRLINLNPSYINPQVNLGNILKDKGFIEEAIISYQNALQLDPSHVVAASNLLLCLCYSNWDEGKIFAEHRKWETRIKLRESGKSTCSTVMLKKQHPLRIGYVSKDFKTHSVAYFIEPILKNHNPDFFSIFCYSDVANPDSVTTRLQQQKNTWRSIHTMDNERVEKMIKNDHISILVDLSGHTGNRRLELFLNKPAPIQVTYLGYPRTTGLSSMDYRFTDWWADPLGQEKYYSEKLIRLSSGFLCYRPPDNSPEIASSPVAQKGFITFGSFNYLPKVNDDVIALWAAILEQIPQSKLMLKAKSLNNKSVQQRYTSLFKQYGIAPTRLLLSGYAPTIYDHLQSYESVDIALDPFPYNGTTTTCEALWMGVPVIVLAGQNHQARVGVSLLSRVGLTGMIAQSPKQYVAIADFFSRNISQLIALRKGLRQNMLSSSLVDAQLITKEIEEVYTKIYEKLIGEDYKSSLKKRKRKEIL